MKKLLPFSSLILLFGFFILFQSCKKVKHDENQSLYNNKRLRDVIVSYMSEPRFRNADFVQQITGTEADLKLFDMDEMMLYFAISKSSYEGPVTLSKLTIDTANVEFGFENNGDTYLGSYTIKGNLRLLFRIPKNDFKPDSSRSVKVSYSPNEYTISVNELADLAENKTIFGGRSVEDTASNKYLANHGAFVSVPHEPSLHRLALQIIKEEKAKETIAQLLLDFVTTNIKYNKDEASGNYEVMKRPNEVLMTGNSDCSGLTILYASLLEQAGINYRMIYFPGHIAIAVEGRFPEINKLHFEHEGIKYSMAETTVKGFIIGMTRLQKDDITNDITYIQKPGKDTKLMKFK